MTRRNISKDWETATWKGSRAVQLQAALAMTLRQRFETLESLSELAQRLATMPRQMPQVPRTKTRGSSMSRTSR